MEIMTEKGQMIIKDIKSEFKTGKAIGYSLIQRKYVIGYNLAHAIISELDTMGYLTKTEFSHLGIWTFNEKLNK